VFSSYGKEKDAPIKCYATHALTGGRICLAEASKKAIKLHFTSKEVKLKK